MSLNQYIDHTLLKAEATGQDIQKLCQEALDFKFKTVCINPTFITLAKNILEDSEVEVCTVVGFPLGASTPTVKAFEAKSALEDGADEIDMVINIGALKEADDDLVYQDVQLVATECKAFGKKLKVILETCLLTEDEIIRACKICTDAGADFVKTSTGFSTSGAKASDILLMKKNISKNMEVKASGGIRDEKTAREMIEAGATRLGTSSSIAIVQGKESKSNY